MHDLAHEICEGRWIVLGGGGYGLVRCVPRAWTHLIAEVSGDRLDPEHRDPAVLAGRRAAPRPAGPAAHAHDRGRVHRLLRWDPFTETRVDRAIMRTRRASFPYFGLDPDDPRD
jgi:acetoin utilization protein AcuC